MRDELVVHQMLLKCKTDKHVEKIYLKYLHNNPLNTWNPIPLKCTKKCNYMCSYISPLKLAIAIDSVKCVKLILQHCQHYDENFHKLILGKYGIKHTGIIGTITFTRNCPLISTNRSINELLQNAKLV